MKIKNFLYAIIFCISTSFLSAQTADEARSLYSKAKDYFNNGDYTTAITYYQKAVPAYEKVYGKNHLYTGDVYFFLGLSYSKIGDYQNAILWLEKSYTVYNMPNGDKSNAANSLNYIANAYFDISEYDKALSYYQKELFLSKEIDGENNKNTANCYANIGLVYEFKGEYKTALSHFEKALAIRKKIFGENDLRTADSYHDIAFENYLLGNYQKALDNFFKAFEIREKVAGQNSYEVAHTLGALATVYIDIQDYDEALRANELAEQIYSNFVNPVSKEFAILYNERGRIFYGQKDYKQALNYWNKALELDQKVYGEKNVYTAKGYLNIGSAYQGMGDYDRAIANLENALAIDKSIFGESNPDIALCYRNLGGVYRSKDDFNTALSYFTKAVEMYKKSLGENHMEIASCYIEIGGIYDNKKDFQKALDYYRKGNNMIFDIFGYETTDIASCYDKIARIYDIMGEHEDAESLYKAAINVYKNICGEESASASIEYNMLGWHYAGLNDIKNTVASFRKSFRGFEKSTNYNQIITSLSLILKDAQTYHYDTDISFIRDTIALTTNTVERARLDMSSIKSDLLQNSLPIYYFGVDFEAKNNNPTKAFEYSEALRSRGFLDEIGLERALLLDGVTDIEQKEIKNLTNKISATRKEIEYQSNLQISERDTQKLSQLGKELSDTEKALAKLDDAIGKRLPAYSQLRNPLPAKIKDAQKWCGKDKAIVEYVLWNPAILDEAGIDRTYNTLQEQNREVYKLHSYCLVITKKQVVAVPLDDDFDFTEAVRKLRDGVIPKRLKPTPETVFEDVRNDLYAKLIEPALPYIKGCNQLLIVPDGSLAFLPFDILRKDEDSKMLCDQFAVSLSPSVSVSMIADSSKTKGLEMLAFGGAWYDKTLSAEEHRKLFDTQDMTRGKSRGFILSTTVTDSENATQDLSVKLNGEEVSVSEYFNRKNLNWHDLPGTLIELNTLKNKSVGSKKYHQFVQENASEMQVKLLSKDKTLAKYPILHFACHGYFDKDNSNMSSILFSEVSGKLSAVSNEDGYLTISEASTLNLDADMVCLSACETGLGEIKTGDGMTGLSRAFMVAGARHVGVSLWQVDDEATAHFMASMYKKIEKKGMTYSQAYQQTKVEFRKSDDYSHPYYWAAFALYE